MKNIADIKAFIASGNATGTLVNHSSGNRFTYRFSTINLEDPQQTRTFVHLLNGPDNESDYVYMATIFPEHRLRITKKSSVTADTMSFRALFWFLRNQREELPESLEFLHSGKCGRCGRKLTTPESIRIGLGPVCASRG